MFLHTSQPSDTTPRPPSAHPLAPQPPVQPRRLWRFAQVVAEVLADQRKPRQLSSLMSGPAYRALLDSVGVYHCSVRPRVWSTHLGVPAGGVTELCAVINCGTRARALALRIETIDDAWICTRLQTA